MAWRIVAGLALVAGVGQSFLIRQAPAGFRGNVASNVAQVRESVFPWMYGSSRPCVGRPWRAGPERIGVSFAPEGGQGDWMYIS
jgi:hypothetical protein